MIKYFPVAILAAVLLGCSSPPETLAKAPRPGIIGAARYSTDDNSISERVTFRTRIAEPQVRTAFEQYCERRRMKRDLRAATSGIAWWQADKYYFGILVSPEEDKRTLTVTYFYNP